MQSLESQALLNRLRKQVDLSPFTPDSNAPSWMVDLAAITAHDPGALAILGPAGLSISTKGGTLARPIPDPSALFISGLSSRLRNGAKRVALGIPPAGRHIPLLMASCAVLASTLDRFETSNDGSTGGVLIISPDLDLRSRYCDLRVGSVILEDAHPGSRLRPDGVRLAIRLNRDPATSRGVCFFLPRLALPPSIDFDPVLVILDCRYSRWVNRVPNLARWVQITAPRCGAVALYTLGDVDTMNAFVQAGWDDLPLDHTAVATCEARVLVSHPTDAEISVKWTLADAPAFLDRIHVVETVPEADALAHRFEEIARLLEDHKQYENPDLYRARWLLAILSHVPTPIVWYEQTARARGRSTLRRLIDQLGYRSRYEPALGPVVQTLRMQLQAVYEELSRANPRCAALRGLLDAALGANSTDSVLVLVRDRTVQHALMAWLDMEAFPGSAGITRLDIISCQDLAEIASRQYKNAIVNGPLPRRYRWVAGAALAHDVTFLAYPHETTTITRQLESMYGVAANEHRSDQRDRVLAAIKPGTASTRRGEEVSISPLRLVLRTAPQTPPPGARPFTTTIRDLSSLREAMKRLTEAATAATGTPRTPTWFEDDGDEDVPEIVSDQPQRESPQGHEDDVEAVRVELRSSNVGQCFAWFAAQQPLECVRPTNPADILRVLPEALESGDVVLLMDEGGRTNLFDRIVDLAEGQPEMQYLASFRRHWRVALQQLVAHYRRSDQSIDYSAILRDLRAAGATIETETTVRLWIADQIIGPEAISSILAVGEISQSPSVVRQATQFDRAFRKIRAIRQGIGRRLSAAIRRSFAHFAAVEREQAGETLDERLGLPLEELIETIDLAEVVAVSNQVQRVPPHWIGRLGSEAGGVSV